MAEPRIAIGVDVGAAGSRPRSSTPTTVGSSRIACASRRRRHPRPTPSAPRSAGWSSASSAATGIGPTSRSASDCRESCSTASSRPLRTSTRRGSSSRSRSVGRSLKRPVTIVNDADAAGTAEMRFGIGAGKQGVVVLLDARDRRRIGRVRRRQARPEHRVRPDGDPRPAAERRSASVARTKRGLSWKAWSQDLDEHLIGSTS